MDNIRKVIKILFRYVSPVEVIQGDACYDKIEEADFIKLANTYMAHYSDNEIENMLSFLKSEFEWHNNKMYEKMRKEEVRQVNVFDAILLFADKILTEENREPLCRYEHLLRWRDMVISLDEDLFITAFLAQKDVLCTYNRKLFFWPPVIGHNNKELNRLMAQGVAENHFHLKGSAPAFHLSWISMMNDVLNPSFHKTFEEYEKRHLSMKVIYQSRYAERTLRVFYLQAALIRLYLFCCLQEDYVAIRKKVPKPKDVTFQSIEEYRKKKKAVLEEDVEYLLNDDETLMAYLPCIQEGILYMKESYAPGQLDYMLCENFLLYNSQNHLNEIITGERWFLYEIFKRVYTGDLYFSKNLNWFYAYILIKENIRAEIIQSNGNVGFHNFLLYQNRKESFIDDTAFENIYLKMAVRDTILNQHIKKLEARVVPKNNPLKLKKAIEKYDKGILEDEINEEDKNALRSRFFYVCHFIKEKDDRIDDDYFLVTECRHFEKRNEVKMQALALATLRETYWDTAQRIRGIDAASEEIVCRPEVFAQAFRFLKNHSVGYTDFMTDEIKKLPDLCITYHVGEDFLDITDGLRAIDEAISFLNMRCGDRLGHALALGVDVDEWYASKSNRILISQMEYLDNLVWLYAKIRKYKIEGCEDTIRYIEKRYDEYFRIVYLNNMSDEYLDSVISDAIDYYEKERLKNNYSNKQCYFSINTYYDSWKLRGDNPEYFKDGFFKLKKYYHKSAWDEYAINKIFPDNYRIRYNPEAAYLFHLYHYSHAVKKEGNKKKEIKVNQSIIKAVKKVQKAMQWVVAKKGICIETNPSSNALIGTFKRYDKHPILNWYNIGLATNTAEIQSVPQIQVSINTDDQGVFATYIENEYAYLALAIEKMKDENGITKFSRTLIYQWLDNIRKMGLAQSFEEIV